MLTCGSITFDDVNGRFTTKTPTWFDANESLSLSYWIIFYYEIALWVHYLAYVRGTFAQHDSVLNRAIFVNKETQYVNLKNEVATQWNTISKD